jgi:hypothetical protein
MSVVTFSAQAIGSGGVQLGPSPSGVTLPTNNNAAPALPVTLAAGFQTIQCPSVASGYTVNGFCIIPVLPGSANAKILKGVTGDTGVQFTTFAAAGAVAGGSFGILSTSQENCMIVWL